MGAEPVPLAVAYSDITAFNQAGSKLSFLPLYSWSFAEALRQT
jgi:hypothetical protein